MHLRFSGKSVPFGGAFMLKSHNHSWESGWESEYPGRGVQVPQSFITVPPCVLT